jgi:hypothetical protein
VLRLVAQLLLRNNQLDKQLGKRRTNDRYENESEDVSRDQLDLFLQAIQQEASQALHESDDKLTPHKPRISLHPTIDGVFIEAMGETYTHKMIRA